MKPSTTRINCSESEIIWTIPNFTQYATSCTYLKSEESFLSLENHHFEWNLLLHPHGKKDANYTSIYFQACTKRSQINVRYQITFQDIKEKDIKSIDGNGSFSKENKSWGFTNFIKREKILSLENDTLIVKSKIRIKSCKNKADIIINNSNSNKDSLENFKSLLDSGSFSDIVLETIDGIKIPAHKCILVAQSPVFAAMFQHNMKESQESTIKIEDIDANILKAMLKFIYSNTFDKNQSELKQLFIVSNKYQVNHLKKMCEDELCQQLTENNAIEYLILADYHEGKNLKLKALAFIKTNREDIIKKDCFKNLIKEHVDLTYDIIKCLTE